MDTFNTFTELLNTGFVYFFWFAGLILLCWLLKQVWSLYRNRHTSVEPERHERTNQSEPEEDQSILDGTGLFEAEPERSSRRY